MRNRKEPYRKTDKKADKGSASGKRQAEFHGRTDGKPQPAGKQGSFRGVEERGMQRTASAIQPQLAAALQQDRQEAAESLMLEGRNAVVEALRSGRSVDKLLVLDGAHDNALGTILREVRRHRETKLEFVQKERLDALSETGKHQGVIAFAAAYDYADIDTMLENAEKKGEPPFLFLLDGIEDPHNLGAIIRTANLCGAHGVIIRANRAVGLTATVAKASAGALNYTPVAKAANMNAVIEQLKQKGLWFVCADMDGEEMYRLDLKGPIGLVIGNEGKGVSALVKKNCDMTAAIPMRGDIDSLNASVAAGVLAYEIVRQRLCKAGNG